MHTSVLECRTCIEAFTSFGITTFGGFCMTELDPLQGLGFWVWGFGSWGVGLGFRVWGPGFRIKADAANKRNLGNMELVYMHTSVLECRTFVEAFTSFGILCACVVLFGDLEPLQASGLWNVFECIVLFGWSSALLHGPGQKFRELQHPSFRQRSGASSCSSHQHCFATAARETLVSSGSVWPRCEAEKSHGNRPKQS